MSIRLLGQVVAVDCETTGLNPYRGDRPFLYAFATDAGKAVAVLEDQKPDPSTGQFSTKADKRIGPNRRAVRSWVADPKVAKVFHNAKFDLKMLAAFGIKVAGPIHDTMIMGHLLSAQGKAGPPHRENVLRKLSLASLTKKYLPGTCKLAGPADWIKAHGARFRKEHNRNANFADVPLEIIEGYAIRDVELTLRLFFLFQPHIERLKLQSLYDSEMELLRAVIRIEDRGLRLNVPFMQKRIRELQQEETGTLRQLRQMIHKPLCKVKAKTRTRNGQKVKIRQLVSVPAANVNFGSDQQLAQIFHGQLKLPVAETTATGRPKMDERTLDRIDHPVAKLVVRYRQYQKTRSTYFEGYLARAVDGILRPNLIQIGAQTGRFSCTDPNMQNVPMEEVVRERAGADVIWKGVKHSIIPREDFANYHADYSQIEMKTMAHFAEDPAIDRAVQERDIHTEITKILYGKISDPQEFESKRVLAKIVSFGVLFGMGRETFKWKLKVDDQKVDEILRHYFTTFPGIKRFQNRTIQQVRETGQLRNIFGRRYVVDPQYAYKGVNYIVQGSAADITKHAMVKLERFFLKECPKACMILQIHDEVVIEMPESAESWLPAQIVRIMQDVPQCRIPLTVSLEREMGSWGELKKITIPA